MYEKFENMTDEELVRLAQEGDNDALEYLLNKYKNFVRSKARSYFLIGADHEAVSSSSSCKRSGVSFGSARLE